MTVTVPITNITQLTTRNHNDLQNRDVSDAHSNLTQITTRNHNDLQNLNNSGHTIAVFPSSELNQPGKLLQLKSIEAVIKDAQIPYHLKKLSNIPQFQTLMKNQFGHFADGTITYGIGTWLIAITFDGRYIWGITNGSPAIIFKIDPTDESYTSLTCATGEDFGQAIFYDGTYIWIGLDTSPFKILKVNPSDMTYTVITGASGENKCYAFTFDGTYVWAGLAISPAKILKINPSDSSYTMITCAAGENSCQALEYDGTYIWAGLMTSPFKILKINPSDNSYTVITGAVNEEYPKGLVFDGSYLWAACYTLSSNLFLKINPSDSTYIVVQGIAPITRAYSITYDGTYIWSCLENTPGRIVKLNPADNTYIVITAAAGENNPRSIIFDGTYIRATISVAPTRIIRKFAYLRKADSFSKHWSNVTVSRLVGTTYTNNDTNRTVQIKVGVRCQSSAAAGIAYIQAMSDSATPPVTICSPIVGIQSGLAGEDNNFMLVADVEPGKNYIVSSTTNVNGTVTLDSWFETYL